MERESTHRNFYRQVGARAKSNGGVLGEDLIVDAEFVKWFKNLDDWADVAAHGGVWRRVQCRIC
jgi:hypothetical protein